MRTLCCTFLKENGGLTVACDFNNYPAKTVGLFLRASIEPICARRPKGLLMNTGAHARYFVRKHSVATFSLTAVAIGF